MGLLHMGQTQRTSSHFTRHLWATEDVRYPNLLWLAIISQTQTILSLLQSNPSLLPAVQTGCRTSMTRSRWEEVGIVGSRRRFLLISFKRHPWTHIPTVDTYFR